MHRRIESLFLAAMTAAVLVACGGQEGPAPEVDGGLPDTGGEECPVPCGGECCPEGQACVEGRCEPACEESAEALCGRLGKICGTLTAEDRCGKVRTVPSCGSCAAEESCNASGTACEPTCSKESDEQFCKRLGKQCGAFAGVDLCGQNRTVECGSCASGKACEQNLCACAAQDDHAFCAAMKVECGSASGQDNCGQPRTVAECGRCADGEICSGNQKCEVCIPDDDGGFCTWLGKNCGSVSGRDRCGVQHTGASCGSCTAPKVCDLNNTCADPSAPSNDNCSNPALLVLDSVTGVVETRGDTTLADNSGLGNCNTMSGKDVVYEFALDSEKTVTVTVTPDAGSAFRPHLYLRTVCDRGASEVACMRSDAQEPGVLTAYKLAVGTYYLWVDGYGGTSNGPFSLRIEATDPEAVPANDVCAGAKPLTFDPNGHVSVSADTAFPGLHDSYQGGCGGNGPDLVYSFQLAKPAKFEATLAKTSSSTLDPILYLRSACDVAASEIKDGCRTAGGGSSSGMAKLSLPLAAGTYYLFVDGALRSKGPFTLDLSKIDLAPNDECSQAEPLTFDAQGGARTTGDTRLAKNDGDPACNSYSGPELVYQFTTGGERHVEIEMIPDAGSALTPNLYLRSGCEEAAQEVACDRLTKPGRLKLVVPRLPAGTWYLFADSYSGSSTGPFSLQVTATAPEVPSNDTCRRAAPLAFDPTTRVATVTGASTSSASNLYAGTCGTHSGPDVVYSFELSEAALITAKVTRSAATPAFKPAVYLRKDHCESTDLRDQASCGNELMGVASATQINAPAGTYYVFVDGIGGTHGEFDLEVSLAPAIDVPDDCFSAKFLDVSSGLATVAGDTSLALNRAKGDCNSLDAKDVVYFFTTTSVLNVDITVTPEPGSALKPTIYVRSVCNQGGTKSEIGCSKTTTAVPGTLSLPRLPAGTWYVWVDGYEAISAGAFTMTVATSEPPDPPENDICPGQVLHFDEVTNKAVVQGSTRFATDDYRGSCNTSPGRDAVYAFTVGGTENKMVVAKVTRAATASSNFLPVVYLRSDCDSAAPDAELACGNQSGGTASATVFSLPPGTYYAIVDGANMDGGAFELEVSLSPSRVYPDTCADAQMLTFVNGKATVSDDTSLAHNSSKPLTCNPNFASGLDLVYRVDTTGMVGNKDIEAKLTYASPNGIPAANALLYLQSACGTTNSAEELACMTSTSATATVRKRNLAPGNYYLWVDGSWSSDKGAFTLEVQLIDAIPNDVCTGAQELTFTGGVASEFGLTKGAYNDYSGSCDTMNGPDVVYKFTVPGTNSVSLSATVARDPNFPDYQPGVYLRSVCDSSAKTDEQSCGKNVNGIAGIAVPSLAPGTYYLIVDGSANTSGAYDLRVEMSSVEVLPDDCNSAKKLVLGANGRAVLIGDITGATNKFKSLTTACTGGAGRDLVYEVDTTRLGTTDFTAKVSFANIGINSALLYLRRVCDSEAAADEVACAKKMQAATLTVPDLAPGTYYLVVDLSSATASGGFTLEVQATPVPAVPTNQTCATAKEVQLDDDGKAHLLGNTRYATNDYSGLCTAMPGADLVYGLTLRRDAMLEVTLTRDANSPTFEPAVYVRAAACESTDAGAQLACAKHTSGVAKVAMRYLQAGTYYIVVDSTTVAHGMFALDVSVSPAVRGDTCADAVTLTLDAAGVALVQASTSRASNIESSCGSGSGNDLVYRLDLPAEKKVDVLLTPAVGSAYRPVISVRSDCGDKSKELACIIAKAADEPVGLSLGRLGPGPQFIWVDGYGSSGDFTLQVTAVDPPGTPRNDACVDAHPLVFDGSGRASVDGETTWATHDSAGACDSKSTGPDVFYSFRLQQEASVVAKVTRDASTPKYSPVVYLRGGDCTAATELGAKACGTGFSGTATASAGLLQPGTYYVIVDGASNTSGKFNLEVTVGNALHGDTCADFVVLPLDPLTGIGVVSSDTTLATDAASGSCGSGDNDLVFAFTIGSEKKVDVEVMPDGKALKPQVYVRKTCDQTSTQLACANAGAAGDPARLTFARLAAGTYYVWVDGSMSRGPFTLKVTAVDPPAPPSNDTCGGVAPMAYDSATKKFTASGELTWATNAAAGTCSPTAGPDLVYTFTTSMAQKVTVKAVRNTADTSFEPVVYVRSECGRPQANLEVTCAKHSSGTATATINNLSGGTWYVWVDDAGAKGGFARFDLEVALATAVTNGPTNESCFSPQVITLNGASASNPGSTVNSQNETGGSCGSATGGDVVYQLTTPHDGKLTATVTPGNGTSYLPAVFIRRSCGSILPEDELNCRFVAAGSKAVTAVAPRAPAGDYWIWVASGAGTSRGNFTLDVSLDAPVPEPDNNTCSAPQNLTPGILLPGDTTSADSSFGPTLPTGVCSGKTVKGPDLVYRYVPAADGNFTVTVTPTGFDVVLWYSTDTCGMSACERMVDAAGSGKPETLTVSGVAGRAYYFFVDSSSAEHYGSFTIGVQ